MKKLVVDIGITADSYLGMYEGTAETVFATTREGFSVRFPANILRPFVAHDGIYGTFAIFFDDDNKFQRIERVA